MVETIEDHNNKLVVDAPHLSKSILDEEAFVLHQVFNKWTGQPAENWQNLQLSFLHMCAQA